MATVEDSGILLRVDGAEMPSDNTKLAETSGCFRRACAVVGGTPVPMFQPTLIKALDCLSGMLPMDALQSTCVFMLFFVALFVDSEVLINYICFDLIDKENCVDILGLVLKLKKKDDFLTKALINYFRSEFKLNPEFVHLSMARNPRKLRWEISKVNGDEHKLNRLAKFPSTCKFCKVVIKEPDHLSRTRKCSYTTCCLQPIHIICLEKVMAFQWSHCPYCKCPYTRGVMEPVGDLSEVIQISVVRANGAPPAAKLVQSEVFRFLDSPYACRTLRGPVNGLNNLS